MHRLVSILRRAHCRCLHHFLALDALELVETAAGARLRGVLLKYHDAYLTGSRAPDAGFQDFDNHAVRTDGPPTTGAARACAQWSRTAIDHLNAERWKKAAYACGVLCHYFTDPLLPPNSATIPQGDAAARLWAWRLYQSYAAARQQSADDRLRVTFQLASTGDWIASAVAEGARLARPRHDRLTELDGQMRGQLGAAEAPGKGLERLNAMDDPFGTSFGETRLRGDEVVAELVAVAVAGWGAVVARLADETSAELPEPSLRWPTLLAAIDVPLFRIVRRYSDATEHRMLRSLNGAAPPADSAAECAAECTAPRAAEPTAFTLDSVSLPTIPIRPRRESAGHDANAGVDQREAPDAIDEHVARRAA